MNTRSSVQATLWIFIAMFGMPALGQNVTCALTQSSMSQITGSCEGIIPPNLELAKSNENSIVLWEGSASENDLTWPIDVSSFEYSDGIELLVMYEMGWFYVTEFDPSRILSWDMSEVAAPSSKDIQVIEIAQKFLNGGQSWNRADNRECPENEADVSLYCSLLQASEQVMGKPYHRQPAMQVIREIIGNRWPDRYSNHRLMEFNNHPSTSFSDLAELFKQAKHEISENMR